MPLHTFLQSNYPLLYKDTLAPTSDINNSDRCVLNSIILTNQVDSWYPGGSGEVFACFQRSGLLEKFLKEGKEHIFISNVENLGATIDLNILEIIF